MPEVGATVIPSLRSNFKWMSAGNVFYVTCQWGMLSILAKAGNASVVGQYVLGLAISAPVFMFTNLNLRAVQATDARSDFEFADYFTLRILASLAGVLTVAVVSLSLNYDVGTRLVIFLLGVAKAIESLGDVVAGLLQRIERIHQVAISLVFRGTLSLGAFGITYLVLRNLTAAVCALVLSWSIVFVAYDLKCAAGALRDGERFLRFMPGTLRRLAVLSAPLGVVMALISLNTNVPRYILARTLGDAKLGIFASLGYVLQAQYLVINAMGDSASARLARMFSLGDARGFRRVIDKLVWIGVGVLVLGTMLAALFGRPLLTLLYRPEYAQRLSVFVVMVAAGGLASIGYFLGYGINAARHFRLQVPMIGLATLTTAALTAVLAPRFGLMGAAAALLCGTLVHAVGNGLALRYAFGQILPQKR